MKTIPDYPWLVKKADEDANFAEVFARFSDVVKASLGDGDEMYTRKKAGFIAWKRWQGSAGLFSGAIGSAKSKFDGTDALKLYFFWLTNYNEFTFRLRGDHHAYYDLTAKFWRPAKLAKGRFGYHSISAQEIDDHYTYELSFVAEDLPAIASPDLICFVESTFEPPHDKDSIWRWPIFAHDQSFPHYAWSKTGWKEYERHRKLVKEWEEKAKDRRESKIVVGD